MLTILLQAAATPNSGMGQYGSLIMMALIFVVFYFFMIRPQMKKQKEIKKFRESITVGDKVITSGGIYGKVEEIKPDSFLLEIAENVRVNVDKSSVFATAADTQSTK